MSREAWVGRSFSAPHISLRCQCGWEGNDGHIDDWSVQRDRDRVVRRCPDCGKPVPEWGTIRSIEAARHLASGSLADALDAASATK